MKILNICILACSLGLFATSCQNKNCETTATTTTTETTSPATATAVTDGTDAAMTAPVDTPAATVAANNSSAPRESAARSSARTTPGMRNRNVKNNTSAQGTGPDLEASKKREGNFTSGTGTGDIGK